MNRLFGFTKFCKMITKKLSIKEVKWICFMFIAYPLLKWYAGNLTTESFLVPFFVTLAYIQGKEEGAKQPETQ